MDKITDEDQKTEESSSLHHDVYNEEIANKRPPISNVPATQRHSGLATPPTTPPAMALALEEPWVEEESTGDVGAVDEVVVPDGVQNTTFRHRAVITRR